MLKPKMLKPGDAIAVVSLSSGDAASHPQRYQAGKAQLEDEFGLRVVEMPNALRDEEWIAKNPQGRAEDLMAAFRDPSIAAIVTASGGDDSLRLLPFLDLDVIRANPKAFLGYSDTTVSHLACFSAGVASFYGPNLMAGFAENGGLFPYMTQSLRRALFQPEPIGPLLPNTLGWAREEVDWDDEQAQQRARRRHPSEPWRFLQGSEPAQGPLIGGCADILELLRGTALWPSPERWDGAILFLETSDEILPPKYLKRQMRVYAAMGIIERLSGILLGRPGGVIPAEEFDAYEEAVLAVVAEEEGRRDLPIVSRMDFGHTDPMLTLPLGVQAQIDPAKGEVSILESAVEAR